MELSAYAYAQDSSGEYIDLVYYLKITADKIDTAKVSSDSNTYYSCSLEKGEYDVIVTKTKEHYGQSFAINNKQIEILVTNVNEVMLVESFKELFPEYADLIVCNDLSDILLNDEKTDKVKESLDSDTRPSIILYSIENMWSDEIIQNEHIVPISNVEIVKDAYVDSYQYAIDTGTYNNELKALTWELCPGYFFYKKDIARDVLGTDNAAEIQEMISDWNGFSKVAAKMQKEGYSMIPSVYSVAYPTLSSRKNAWVNGNDFTADKSIDTYFARAKNLTDKGYAENYDMWSDEWYEMKNSFGNFGASWSNSIDKIFDGSTSYGMCMGPSAYNWGGEAALVTDNCENEGLLELFLYVSCCNNDGMRDIINTYAFDNLNGDANYVPNNKQVVGYYANGDYTIGRNYFYGQNVYEYFDNILNNVTDGGYWTEYDALIKSEVMEYSKKYIAGEYKDEKEAIEALEAYLKEKYELQ